MNQEIIGQEDGLCLRQMTLEDSPLIVRWRNQDWVREHYIYRGLFTLEGQEAYYHSKVETGEVIQFIVCETANGMRPVGCTVLNDIDREKGCAEYGMFLGEADAAGRGSSAKMVRMTLRYCFSVLGLSRVVCRIFTDNLPSIRGCERGGFRIVEKLPDVVCSDGAVKDMYLLEACREEG